MAHIRVPPMDAIAKVSLYLCAAAIFLTGSVTGLKCYQCTITPPGMLSNQTSRLCVNFDGSDKYIVDCPYSTMCMKQAFDLVLANKERVIHGVLRDCAAQKHEYQVYKGGMWHPATDVQEVYQEGCHMQDDKGERSLSTEYCYCRNHLCNAAPPTKGGDLNYHTDAMAVIMVFNAMKYIRSMR